MINKISKKLIIYISVICLIYSIIVFSFITVPFFDKNLLLKLFEKHDVYRYVPFVISKSDIEKIVYELMDYLQGKSNFLDTKVVMDGIFTDFYSLTSKIHMADCRNLFLFHKHLATLSIFISIFGLIYSYFVNNNFFKKLYICYRNCLIIFLIISSSIFIFAFINFDLFFTAFHKIFFNNDLWLFNPDVDYIINFLPESLFAEIGTMIIIFTVFLLLLIYLFCYLAHKILSRQEAK